MILNLSDVLSEQHKAIRESVPIEMNSFKSEMGTYNITDKTPLELSVEYAGERKLWVRGKGEITAVAPCDRCLDDVEVKVVLEFEHKITTDTEAEDQSEELDENNYIDGYSLDVEQLVYNELLTGWPTKILCSDDCKGICNVCGQNLNRGTCNCEDTSLDPRMSVIRDVFKNFKEV